MRTTDLEQNLKQVSAIGVGALRFARFLILGDSKRHGRRMMYKVRLVGRLSTADTTVKRR